MLKLLSLKNIPNNSTIVGANIGIINHDKKSDNRFVTVDKLKIK